MGAFFASTSTATTTGTLARTHERRARLTLSKTRLAKGILGNVDDAPIKLNASQAALIGRQELARRLQIRTCAIGIVAERHEILLIALGLWLVAETFRCLGCAGDGVEAVWLLLVDLAECAKARQCCRQPPLSATNSKECKSLASRGDGGLSIAHKKQPSLPLATRDEKVRGEFRQ